MAEEIINQTVEEETAAKRLQRQDTMEDFWRPVSQAVYSTVRQPAGGSLSWQILPPFSHL